MSRAVSTIVFLLIANVFMTFAWYGHLKLFGHNGKSNAPLFYIILFSWGIAFFEYCFQVPANRLGSMETGGPFSLLQLKIIQEVITLIVFLVFSALVFKGFHFTTNHFIGCCLLVGAVYFIFKS